MLGYLLLSSFTIGLLEARWPQQEFGFRKKGPERSPMLPYELWKETFKPRTQAETEAWDKRKIKYWKNAVIPYQIHCSVENLPKTLQVIHKAMQEWERKTCIRFVKRTNETFYLEFHRVRSCWGHVGESSDTRISVGPGCDYSNILAHEIGHVVGMFHEHNRKDRDEHVEVIWENIGMKASKFKKTWRDYRLDVEYDYESIMHYPWSAFSANDNATLRPRRQRNGKVPYKKVSKADIKMTSLMYKCPAIERQRRKEMMHHKRKFKNQFDKWDCVDKHYNCERWAAKGHCKTYKNIRDTCKRSCRSDSCYGGHCQDIHRDCPDWKEAGHCKSVEIVQVRCQKSCNPFCHKCADKLHNCTKLASQGKCSTDESVRTKCKTSCGAPSCYTQQPVVSMVPSYKGRGDKRYDLKWPNRNYIGSGRWCKDWHKKCREWAYDGDCEKNPRYMLRNCLRSCPKARCDKRQIRPPGLCTDPLGLSADIDGRSWLPDSAFSADQHLVIEGWEARPENARLYFEDDPITRRIGAWCSLEPTAKYLQVDLQDIKTITYIATQGRAGYFETVWSFNIQYSEIGTSYRTYQEDGKDRLFYGNCDYTTPTLNRFKNKIRARYIRYIPKGTTWPCVRMEFYGCR